MRITQRDPREDPILESVLSKETGTEMMPGLLRKIALVCSHGGHLTEARLLQRSLRNQATFIITYESVRTRAFEGLFTVPNIGSNPVRMLFALLRLAIFLSTEKPDLVISTGV